MKRRDFLTQTGLILAALGVSETGLPSRASRYQQALAEPTRRKLALLIGINQYPDAVIDTQGVKAALNGCTTDVALQKELLIHRFGFKAADILTLTNAQATRQGIVDAFIEHLYKQAQPGDTVILHFSGYGGQLRLEGGETNPPVMGWVPVDGVLPTESKPAFNDLLVDDVKQLLRLLKTRQLTTVLDAGFSDASAGLSASFHCRARPVIPTGAPPQPLPMLTSFFEQVGKPEVPTLFPGLLLRAARPEQPVVERAWDEFSAGLFTYALTRYLWSATPATKIYATLGRTRETVTQWVPEQLPLVAGKRQPEVDKLYDGAELTGKPADAVVSAIASDGRTADIWLGGLSAEIVQYTDSQTWMQAFDPAGELGPKMQLRSRHGLKARARWPEDSDGGWFIGQRLCEATRVLPKNVNLVVALDNSLKRIERVDATSALSSLPFVSSLSTSEQPADCLFGKTLASEAALTASLATAQAIPDQAEAYGLFLPTHQLIPGTLVKQDEAIKAAITRLTPKLQTMLAMKLLRLTENQSSSRMPVRVNLEMVTPQEKLLQQRETLRSATSLPQSRLAGLMSKQERPLNLNLGSRIRYRLFNFGQTPLYFMLISLDGRERPNIFFPPLSRTDSSEAMVSAAQENLVILPGQSVNVPQTGTNWSIEEPAGSIDTYAIFSQVPFTETIQTLLPLAGRSTGQRISLADNALDVIQALLSDLSNQSAEAASVSDAYTLEVSNWATLNMSFQSV
ncbi:MAG: caspase family protein, partial [Cyanobacteria bacterium P01_F01_bin.4]